MDGRGARAAPRQRLLRAVASPTEATGLEILAPVVAAFAVSHARLLRLGRPPQAPPAPAVPAVVHGTPAGSAGA